MSNQDITLSDVITHMNNGFRALQLDVGEMKKELKTISNRLGIIEQDIVFLREDVGALSGEVVKIKEFVDMSTNSY
jgi:hypothetical protein